MKGALTEVRKFRFGTVEITPELLLDLLKVSPAGERLDNYLLFAESDPIPTDAKALRCGIGESGNVILVFESNEMPLYYEGGMPKRLTPVFKKTLVDDR